MTSTHAQAAAMIRKHLKSLGIPARVKSESYAGGNSINVHVTDIAPTIANELRKYLRQYEMGTFDGMTDYYDCDNCRNDIPQVKYVFLNNDISTGMSQEIWDYLRAKWGNCEQAPANYTDAHNYRIGDEWASTLIHRVFNATIDSKFWESSNTLAG